MPRRSVRGSIPAWRRLTSTGMPGTTCPDRWLVSECWRPPPVGRGRWRPACSPTWAPTSIKCEVPVGEMSRHLPVEVPGTSLSFLNQAVNRNKRSLSLDLHKPGGRDGVPGAGCPQRRRGRELPARHPRRLGGRLRGLPGGQARHRLRVDLGLGSVRSGVGPRRLRPDRAGGIRLDGAQRPVGRRADQGTDLSLRRPRRAARRDRGARRPSPSGPDRRGSARRLLAARRGAVPVQRLPDPGGDGQARAPHGQRGDRDVPRQRVPLPRRVRLHRRGARRALGEAVRGHGPVRSGRRPRLRHQRRAGGQP